MDRKSLGALVIGMPLGEASKAEDEAREEDENREELKALHDEALDTVFDAVKANDREAFRAAFTSAVRVCAEAERMGMYDEDEGGELPEE